MTYRSSKEIWQKQPKKTKDLYESSLPKENDLVIDGKSKEIFGETCLYKELQNQKKQTIVNREKKINPEIEKIPGLKKESPFFTEGRTTLEDVSIEPRKSKNKYCTLNSFAIIGLDALEITIEASISPGISRFDIIGLGDTAVKEARERVNKAITQCGYTIPSGNITINLAPAKMRKKGSLYDLPIALTLLYASKQIHSKYQLSDFVVAGELSLDGKVRSVEGVYARLLSSLAGKNTKRFIIPKENLADLYPLKDVLHSQIKAVSTLKECIEFLNSQENANIEAINLEIEAAFNQQREKFCQTNHESILKNTSDPKQKDQPENLWDFNEIVGQEMAKLALQLAVISNLNVLFIGPPGNGKSMLMRRIPTILPKLNKIDALMLARIEHACHMKNYSLERIKPFREVHNSIPITSLIGGGIHPKPGEISLAHKGFLFMDEISLFPQATLQSLRTPIEQKKITLNRLSTSITYPANFTLLACCNPCPCGFYGDPEKICTCSKSEVNRFFSRLSQPFIDRFDIILYLGKVSRQDFNKSCGQDSATIKQKIDAAIKIKDKNPAFYQGKKMTEVLDENPIIKEITLQAIEKEIISLRRVHSIMKVLHAMMIYEDKEYDRLMLLQAIDLVSNKLKK